MSENKNAFEKLKEENEAKFKEYDSKVKLNLDGRKDIWSFFGEIIELYIPKILTVLLGGNSVSDTNKLSDSE